MDDPTLPLPGLSPIAGRSVKACFDGGSLSSDAGVLVLREIESRLGVAERLARCIADPRNPDLITHSLADMIRFRMMMIAAGYEDGNDAASLRQDPVFKMAQGIAPSDHHLASQPTISRLENMADVRALLRMATALVDLYCASFKQVPKRIILDIDDTFDAVHGGQQLRLFNGHYDEYGFQPLVVFALRQAQGEGRRPLRHGGAAPGAAAEGRRDPRPSAPPHPRHPQPLARRGDPDPRRQPLWSARGDRPVPGDRGRLHSRRPDQHAAAETRQDAQGPGCGPVRSRARYRQGATLHGCL